jgi:hypothetical protein
MAMAHAYRAFAHAHAATYGLMYLNFQAELRPDDALLPALALPIQSVFAELVGESHALVSMAGAWSMLHGFVMLEIAQQFRRLTDADTAFDRAFLAYLNGWKNIL